MLAAETVPSEPLRIVKRGDGDAMAFRVVRDGELKDLFFVRDKTMPKLDVWIPVDNFIEFKRLVENG